MMIKECKKILVVDDDRALTAMLETLLSEQGFKVFVAFDGLDGMVKVREFVPDLVILDIIMPELNGYDVCSHLKFDPKLKNIPIIILTSREQEIDSRIGALMGISYLQKPIEGKVLVDKVLKILNPPSSISAVIKT